MKKYVAVLLSLMSTLNAIAQDIKSLHNPVLNKDFADPTVINDHGVYYAYATQSSYDGKMLNIQLATSTDLVAWKILGDALPVKPSWANKTQDFWAPHVILDTVTKKYVMFYCAKNNDTAFDKCIGVAFADKPTGPFTDKGSPLITGKGFSEIDPMAMVDPKTHKKILYWGSGFQPIRVQELNDDWSSFKEESSPLPVVFPGKEKNYTHLIEGAWIDYHEGKYYLYYSGDNCCGAKANYAVLVARADNAFGPFETLGEANGTGSSVILEKDSAWLAPGHNSIFRDAQGKIWMAYHAIPKPRIKTGENQYSERVMCINPMEYINGWPTVIKKY